MDDETVFTYDSDTEVHQSCAATLNDEFWVIGGSNKKRQVIMVHLKSFPKVFAHIVLDKQNSKLQIEQGWRIGL